MQGTSYGDLDETNKKTCIHTDPTGLYTITASDERKQSKTAGIKPALSGIKDHSSCKIEKQAMDKRCSKLVIAQRYIKKYEEKGE